MAQIQDGGSSQPPVQPWLPFLQKIAQLMGGQPQTASATWEGGTPKPQPKPPMATAGALGTAAKSPLGAGMALLLPLLASMLGQEGGAAQAELQRILLALKKMGAVTLPVKSPMGGEVPEQSVHEFIAKYAPQLRSTDPGAGRRWPDTFVGRV